MTIPKKQEFVAINFQGNVTSTGGKFQARFATGF